MSDTSGLATVVQNALCGEMMDEPDYADVRLVAGRLKLVRGRSGAEREVV
jgi:hypothetical protein